MLSLLSWQKAIYYLAQVIYYQDDDLALTANSNALSQMHLSLISTAHSNILKQISPYFGH